MNIAVGGFPEVDRVRIDQEFDFIAMRASLPFRPDSAKTSYPAEVARLEFGWPVDFYKITP